MDPQPTPPEDASQTELKQIRTYQGDVARAIANQKESLVTIARQEHIKNASSTEADTGLSSLGKKLLLILGALVLIALAGGIGWYSYQTYLTKTAPPPQVTPLTRLIPVTSDVSVDATLLNRDALVGVVGSVEGTELADGEINQILLRRGASDSDPLLTTGELLTLLETHAPSQLVRALDPLFMFGTLGGATTSNFIIIKVDSYDNAFAGMLAWEPTLAGDVGDIFTTREELKSITSASVLQDIADQNKDIRAVLGPNGEAVLLYTFLDNNTLIITDHIETLRALIDRLTRQKLVR